MQRVPARRFCASSSGLFRVRTLGSICTTVLPKCTVAANRPFRASFTMSSLQTWDEVVEPPLVVRNYEDAKADVEKLMSNGQLDRASKLLYEVLDWLSKMRKQRPHAAPEYHKQTIEALTMLGIIFGRRENYTEALQCIQKVLRMHRSSVGSYVEDAGNRPRNTRGEESMQQRERLKGQAKNLLDTVQAVCVFAELVLQHYEKQKLVATDWEIKDESSSILDTVENQLNAAKEMLRSDLLQTFLEAYPSDTLRVMSPFSSLLVSPTVLKIEAKQAMLRLEVESDLLIARLLKQRKLFADAHNVLQGCLTNVENELGSVAVGSPFLAATFTGIADARLSLYLQGEAAQFGASQAMSQEEVKEAGEESPSDDSADETNSSGSAFPRLSFESKEEYLEEIDALLAKAVTTFAGHNELSMFPYYEAHSKYLRGKVLALRSKMSQEALEMVALLLPDKDSTPFAWRAQAATHKAEKVIKLAKNMDSFQNEAEQMLKKAYQAKKKLFGTTFHHEVTECLIALLEVLLSQPSKQKEVLHFAADAYEHLDFLPRNNPIFAQLLEVLAKVKELNQEGLHTAEEFRKRAIEAWHASKGPSHPSTLDAKHHLMNLYLLQQRWKDAERGTITLAKAWKKRLRQGVPVHNILADLVHEIALLQTYQGNSEEAVNHLRYGLKLLAQQPEDTQEEYFHRKITAGTIETTLGWHLYNAEEMEKALPHLQNATECLERKYLIIKRLPPDVRSLLARLYDQTNRLDVGRTKGEQMQQSTSPKTTDVLSKEPNGWPTPSKADRRSAETGEVEEEDDEEELTALSREDRAAMPNRLKEEMKETISAVRQASLARRKMESEQGLVGAPSEEDFLQFVRWDSVEEFLLHTLHAVVDISFLVGLQPHLVEGYAKKAVELATEMYGFLEDPSLPKPPGMQGTQLEEAALSLRSQLISYGATLHLLQRDKEAEIFFSRATLLDTRYNLSSWQEDAPSAEFAGHSKRNEVPNSSNERIK